jgi:hypothetical protein
LIKGGFLRRFGMGNPDDDPNQEEQTLNDPTANLEQRFEGTLERTPKEARYKRIFAKYQAYIDMAWADFKEKRYIMAAKRFQAAGDMGPDQPEPAWGLFITAFANLEARGAIRGLDHLINDFDADLSPLLNEIDVIDRYGDPQEYTQAIKELDRQIILEAGDSSTIQAVRAFLAWCQGDKDDALNRARRLKNSPTGTYWRRLLYHFQKAMATDSSDPFVDESLDAPSADELDLP